MSTASLSTSVSPSLPRLCPQAVSPCRCTTHQVSRECTPCFFRGLPGFHLQGRARAAFHFFHLPPLPRPSHSLSMEARRLSGRNSPILGTKTSTEVVGSRWPRYILDSDLSKTLVKCWHLIYTLPPGRDLTVCPRQQTLSLCDLQGKGGLGICGRAVRKENK